MNNIQLEEAIKILLENTKAIEDIEEVSILDATSLILAEDIYAPISNPPFDRSPLDGFALHHLSSRNAEQDLPVDLSVCEEIMAGDWFDREIPVHSAVRIMTGAPIPKGCNCVIKQEETDYNTETKRLKIYRELQKDENYCFEGEDYVKGELLIKKGEKLSSNHIGLIASLGIERLRVYRRPVIGVVTTGNELIHLGERLTSGKIYNSNLYLLSSKLKTLGCNVVSYPSIEDDPYTVSEFIKNEFSTLDMMITTGGVSVGELDIMHDVINLLKCRRLFWRVDIQPGTPVMASLYEDKILLSLSGNPFAALVNFELLGRPLLSKLSRSLTPPSPRRKGVIAKGSFSKKSKRRRFIRAFYDNGRVILDDNKHSSGQISSTLNKNALIDIKKGSSGLSSGDEVEVILID